MVASLARVGNGANTNLLAYVEVRDLGSHCFNHTNNLMAWHQREIGPTPIIAPHVDIGVTDTAEKDFDAHIMISNITAYNLR
jgi:hypothetical protein